MVNTDQNSFYFLEDGFRATFEQAAVGIAHISPKGKFLRINHKFCDIVGYSLEEMVDLTFQDITHPDDLEADLEQVKDLLADKKKTYSMEKRYFHKKGHVVWVKLTVSLVKDRAGKSGYFVAIVENIDQRKKAEEERIRLFNLSNDLIGIAGFDGYFKQLNPAWQNALGYMLDEIMAKPFQDFVHPDDRGKTSSEMEKLSTGAKTINFENRYFHKDGSVRHISWTATPLPEEGMLYCIGRDVTERNETERKILEYQDRLKKLATELTLAEEIQRQQIAADLHDHVGQLLASTRLQLAALTNKMAKSEISDKLNNISKDILSAIQATRKTISELSLPELNEIGLVAALADWMDEEVEHKHGIKVTLTGDDFVFALEENIRILVFRCVREILINVIKHAKASQVNIDIKAGKKNLTITVLDDGTGFNYDPGILRGKGSGFGLFSIQERIEDIGGSLEINSTPGEGTKIVLTVPMEGKQ